MLGSWADATVRKLSYCFEQRLQNTAPCKRLLHRSWKCPPSRIKVAQFHACDLKSPWTIVTCSQRSEASTEIRSQRRQGLQPFDAKGRIHRIHTTVRPSRASGFERFVRHGAQEGQEGAQAGGGRIRDRSGFAIGLDATLPHVAVSPSQYRAIWGGRFVWGDHFW